MNILTCSQCRDEEYPWRPKTWRNACDDCAAQSQRYHQDAFPGHVVELVHQPDQPPFKQQLEEWSKWPRWAS